MILHREYSRLMQPVYAAVLSMECEDDYSIEVLDREVRVIKQVKALSNDLLNPRHRVTYILVGNEPRTVRMRLSRTIRFIIDLLAGS